MSVTAMNCDECKEVLSTFLDNELGEEDAASVREHLAECGPCAAVCEDLSSILFACTVDPVSEVIPPNSRAMWCRINNIIESESENRVDADVPPRRRFWQLSVPQAISAAAGIVIVSSLLTVAAIRNYNAPPEDGLADRNGVTQSIFEKVLSKVGIVDTPQQARDKRLKQQQAAILYWNDRVQKRRAMWDNTTREAFDRNLQVIDESLDQYTQILQQDPDDALSVEMLDSVMTEKMNLLRDFAEL